MSSSSWWSSWRCNYFQGSPSQVSSQGRWEELKEGHKPWFLGRGRDRGGERDLSHSYQFSRFWSNLPLSSCGMLGMTCTCRRPGLLVQPASTHTYPTSEQHCLEQLQTQTQPVCELEGTPSLPNCLILSIGQLRPRLGKGLAWGHSTSIAFLGLKTHFCVLGQCWFSACAHAAFCFEHIMEIEQELSSAVFYIH
jgi:hypothetical protein